MRTITDYLGEQIEIDPLEDRDALQLRAVRGTLSIRGYWANLQATWPLLTDAERAIDKTRTELSL